MWPQCNERLIDNGLNQAAWRLNHCHRTAPSCSKIRKPVPRRVGHVVSKCLRAGINLVSCFVPVRKLASRLFLPSSSTKPKKAFVRS